MNFPTNKNDFTVVGIYNIFKHISPSFLRPALHSRVTVDDPPQSFRNRYVRSSEMRPNTRWRSSSCRLPAPRRRRTCVRSASRRAISWNVTVRARGCSTMSVSASLNRLMESFSAMSAQMVG